MNNRNNGNKLKETIKYWLIVIEILLFIFTIGMVPSSIDKCNERLDPASEIIVYVTRTGDCYHRNGCRYLNQSKIQTTLYYAHRGHRACLICKPDSYSPVFDPIDNTLEYLAEGHGFEFLSDYPVLSIMVFIAIPIAICILDQKTRAADVPVQTFDKYTNTTPKTEKASTTHATLQEEAQKTCLLLWVSTYRVAKYFRCEYSFIRMGRIWAVLFYISAKHIRNQVIVTEIYSHFESCALQIAGINKGISEASYLRIMRNSYTEYAKILNKSNIDPRIEDGMRKLWLILGSEIELRHDLYEDARKAFYDYSKIIIDDAKKYANRLT